MGDDADRAREREAEAEAQRRQREQLLQQAVDAAAAGNLRDVLDAIQQSEVFDGFLRRLCARWPSLHEMDLSAVLWSEVIDGFYIAIRRGERPANIAAWLWKVAWVKTFDLHGSRSREQPLTGAESSLEEQPESAWDDGEERRAERVRKAIELARTLLPRLGEENVQLVIGYILDAYAAGRWDVSNHEIETSLGRTSECVRQWRLRGFRRLIREAKKEQLVNPEFDISQFEREAAGETDDAADEDDT